MSVSSKVYALMVSVWTPWAATDVPAKWDLGPTLPFQVVFVSNNQFDLLYFDPVSMGVIQKKKNIYPGPENTEENVINKNDKSKETNPIW